MVPAEFKTARSRPGRHFLGLSARFNAVFVILLLIAAFNVISIRNIFNDADGVAETINVAGKLRMLSQKIALKLAIAQQPDDVRAAVRDYEAALTSLEQGGSAFGFELPALPPAMQPHTARLRSDWSLYRAHIDTVLGGAGDAAALEQLQRQADRVLNSAEQLVAALTESAREVRQQALYWLYALFAVEAVIFAVVLLLIRRRIVRPLLDLAGGARALSDGRYDFRVKFRSRDEIGELVTSFNDAAHRIGLLINEIKHEREQLQEAESMFRGFAENSIVGVCIVQDRQFLFVNQTLAQMFAYERHDMLQSMSLVDIIDSDSQPDVLESIRQRADGEVDNVIYEARGRRRDGSTLDVQVFGSKMALGGGNAMLGVLLDITTRRAQQRELEYLATHDALTGLANRTLLGDRIHQAIALAQRAQHSVAVLLLDLNDFKMVNDSLGHGAGDALLHAVALRLQESIRDGDTVARFGGDEFVIVMPDIGHSSDAAVVAHKILALLAEPFDVAGQEIFIHASIGIALYPQDGDAETLIKSADLAMYRAKQERREGFRFYSEELNQRNSERLLLVGELHHALNNHTLRLEYQPKVCLRSGRIIGAEALLRWQHPRLGRVPPLDFVPLAEETGLIIPIGEWVIRTACAQHRQWREAGLTLPSLAVNVSGKQLRNARLLHTLAEALAGNAMAPAALELELTESILIEQHDEIIAMIVGLRQLGVKFSLDDFGTGYSSLTYLKRFPFDHLKLDKSFIDDIAGEGGEIVKTVIRLGQALGLRTVAEGVETPQQVQFLLAHGCDEAQGYLFSPPLPPDAFATLLATQPLLLR